MLSNIDIFASVGSNTAFTKSVEVDVADSQLDISFTNKVQCATLQGLEIIKSSGSLDLTELSRLDAVLNYATAKGIKVLLDPHNYGKLNDDSNVSRLIGVDPLMPSSMLADFWKKVAVDSVNAIRSTGSRHRILMPGTRWTGAHSWVGSGNAAAWNGFRDINFAYEMHQYLDADSSGTTPTCVVGNGATKLQEATNWARAQGAKVLLGEIGWATNGQCMTEGDAITKFMSDNRDVWMGYAYWAAGPWWGEYMFTLEPQGLGTTGVTDRPQMSILQKYN